MWIDWTLPILRLALFAAVAHYSTSRTLVLAGLGTLFPIALGMDRITSSRNHLRHIVVDRIGVADLNLTLTLSIRETMKPDDDTAVLYKLSNIPLNPS